MSNVNKIVLVGKVSEKPETKFGMENNSSMAKFTIAVDRPDRQDGTHETDLIPVVLWGKAADYTAEHIHANSLVVVDGRIQVRTEDKNGQREWHTEVISFSVKSLDNLTNSTSPNPPNPPNPSPEKTPAANASSPQEDLAQPDIPNPFANPDSSTEDDIPF